MLKPHELRHISGTVMAFAWLMLLTGCGQPSEEMRQNRRLTDALLTSVTLKNAKELEKNKLAIDLRRKNAVLSESNHKILLGFYLQAKAGKWTEAEEALYKFREAEPFPK